MQKWVVIAVCLVLTGCNGKVSADAPSDGAVVCSLTNEGYVVRNSMSVGFTVQRVVETDKLCAQRYKTTP